MTALTETFAALADPTRLSLVERLTREGELPAGVLVEGTGISGAAVSRHLKVLREAGLVSQRARGNCRLYSISPEGIGRIDRWTRDQRAFWEAGLDRLEAAIALDQEDGS